MGKKLQTPLFVPSFSSKGFGFREKDGDIESDITDIFEKGAEIVENMPILVSAYDLHHKFIPEPTTFRNLSPVTFVDSGGGYEKLDDGDMSETKWTRQPVLPWSRDLLDNVYKSWPSDMPAAFVNYDRPDNGEKQSLSVQIEEAGILISGYPRQLTTLLIKPEHEKHEYVLIKDIAKHYDELARFSIIGITEKEAGSSFLEKMEFIARLRDGLDSAGYPNIPIHVFGSLDPISSCLYFLAGAEIFDGLAWLRYVFNKGHAVYTRNMSFLNPTFINHSEKKIQKAALVHNQEQLQYIQRNMKVFVESGGEDWESFKKYSEYFKEAYKFLESELGKQRRS